MIRNWNPRNNKNQAAPLEKIFSFGEKVKKTAAAAAGFTLLEVMIALIILSTILLVVIDSQNSAMIKSRQSRNLTLAVFLCKKIMTEKELSLTGKAFIELKEKEEGDFGEAFSNFRWEAEIEKFTYDLSFMADIFKEEQESPKQKPLLLNYLPQIQQMISDSVRELKVTVFWKEGGYTKNYSLKTHLINYQIQVTL